MDQANAPEAGSGTPFPRTPQIIFSVYAAHRAELRDEMAQRGVRVLEAELEKRNREFTNKLAGVENMSLFWNEWERRSCFGGSEVDTRETWRENHRRRRAWLGGTARLTSLIKPSLRFIRGTLKGKWVLPPCSQVSAQLSLGGVLLSKFQLAAGT